VAGDAVTLAALLSAHPELARARSTRDHHSTLLHYVSANGVEDFRQVTPKNIVALTRLLLDAGADVNAASDAYGGGSTALGLVATSIHPEQAGVQIELLETLLANGAKIEGEQAGNDHGVVLGCLANGQPAAARFFADRGAPLNLVEAAGVGRLDRVASSSMNMGNRVSQSLGSARLRAAVRRRVRPPRRGDLPDRSRRSRSHDRRWRSDAIALGDVRSACRSDTGTACERRVRERARPPVQRHAAGLDDPRPGDRR
jgi:hypothetical protein